MHGEDPIPVREPPCVKDATICRKVRPGYSDLSEENLRIVADIEFLESIGQPADDPEYRRYRKILQDERRAAEEARSREEQNEMLLALVRAKR